MECTRLGLGVGMETTVSSQRKMFGMAGVPVKINAILQWAGGQEVNVASVHCSSSQPENVL